MSLLRGLIVALVLATFAGAVHAQPTLDGLPRVAQWTDLESGAGELPVNVWGSCAQGNANRVGIRVDFQNGASAFATYSGVAGRWNTADFPPILPDTSGGFFSTCGGIHFLFNDKNVSLPLAWDACVSPFSDNFDLDAGEDFGSNWRADSAGWVSVAFQTYCGSFTAGPSAAVPGLSSWSLAATVLALALLAFAGMARRRAR